MNLNHTLRKLNTSAYTILYFYGLFKIETKVNWFTNGQTALNVENAWQYSKVYDEFFDKENDAIKLEYFDWRLSGYNKSWAERYPIGKGRKALFSLLDGKRLNYIEARKKIYVPLYSGAVLKTKEYQILVEEYKEKKDIVILDFDAYDHRKLGMTYKDVINDKSKKMGHGFVLAAMLEAETA